MKEQNLWLNGAEILKIEVTIISFIYVAYTLIASVLASHNSLLFSLAAPNKPRAFAPYWSLFNNMLRYSVLTMVCLAFGLLSTFLTEHKNKTLRIVIFLMNLLCFFSAMIIFTYQIFKTSNALYFY